MDHLTIYASLFSFRFWFPTCCVTILRNRRKISFWIAYNYFTILSPVRFTFGNCKRRKNLVWAEKKPRYRFLVVWFVKLTANAISKSWQSANQNCFHTDYLGVTRLTAFSHVWGVGWCRINNSNFHINYHLHCGKLFRLCCSDEKSTNEVNLK